MSNRVYWWTPPIEPETLTDDMILAERALFERDKRPDRVDECDVALGRFPNGMTDCVTGEVFDAFDARRRIVGYINERIARTKEADRAG